MSELCEGATVAVLQESYVETEAENREEERLLQALTVHREDLQSAGNGQETQSWLRSSLQTTSGTRQLYGALQQYVQKPAFLDKLTAARAANAAAYIGSSDCSDCQQQAAASPVDSHTWTSNASALDSGSGSIQGLVEEESFGSYVLVEKADVLDAIGTFVAAYLATVPQAQNMKPADLQQALTSTFKDLQRGRVQRVWAWGRCMYRCIAFSYGAFSVYENPWLVRAVITALWAAGKVMLGMLL